MSTRTVNEHVMNLTRKMGVHPHKLTKEHVMSAVADGTIDPDECDDLLNFLDGPSVN